MALTAQQREQQMKQAEELLFAGPPSSSFAKQFSVETFRKLQLPPVVSNSELVVSFEWSMRRAGPRFCLRDHVTM